MTPILIVFLAILTASSGLSLQAPRTLVVEQGSSLKILCDIKQKLNESNVSYTARDVHWYLADTMLPPGVQTVVNNTTTQLTLENVAIQDSGNYSCVLGASAQENIATAITHLQVGTKPGIVNFTCVCYNMGDMWCTWEPIDSYLPTTYEFTWRLYYEPSWKACPDDTEKGPNSCFFDFYANQGSEHVMRVSATNALGQMEEDKHFNPDSDTIPYPPENVRVVVKTARSVQVQWDPPSDWYADIFFLQYKLQYQSEWELGEWLQQPHIDRTEHYRIRQLEPFTTYDFRVSCKPMGTDGHWSAWSEISTGKTRPQEPDEGVRLFINQEIIKNVMSRDVTISWTLPEKRERNGIIIGFRVAWLEEGSSKRKMIDIQDGNQTMYTITDLSVFRSYTVSVVMYNSVGDSPVTQIHIVEKPSVKPRTTLLYENFGELDTRTLGIYGHYHYDWIIVAESGHVIALNFNAFHIIGGDACKYLFVKINTGDEEFGPFCGDVRVSNFPTIIHSINNVMTIRYVDQSYFDEGRVQARYNIIDPSLVPRCRSLQAPVNGRIIGRYTTYDQFVWFKCDDGYYMDGSMTRLCTEDGTWTGVQPHCYPPYRLMNESTGIILLPPYIDYPVYYEFEWEIVVEMGYVINLEFDHFAVGKLRTWEPKCYRHLKISEGTRVLDHLCGNNSINNVPAAIQSSGNVMKLQYPIPWPRNPDNFIARYYVQGVDCGRPEEIANGYFTNDNFTYLNTIIYSCNAFHKLLGKTERTCQANATWSGTKPHCEPVCGIPMVTPRWRSPVRIFGGRSVLRGSWPWTTFLSVHSPAHGVRKAICGGSLLNNEWVVTAAHCVINPQANSRTFGHTLPLASFNVSLGLHRRSRPHEYVQYRKVVEIIPSPHNDPKTFDADIALLKLDIPVAFTKYMQPVCLPLNDTDNGVADQGDLAVVVGWGKTSNGRPSDVLKETYVPIVSQQTCVKAYNRSYVVTNNMFCAGYQTGRFDSCDGDSGGPLMLQDGRSQRYYLYGIVSWGRPGQCAVRDSYGVYVNVSNFTPWIQEITNLQP